jgi:transposase
MVAHDCDDLNGERNRLCNRLREQLWRYFPAMLELDQDLGAEWFLDLWELVPTPDKAVRIRETSIARILKSRRIRRLTAAEVLAMLRKPPVTVAPGTIEAASAHIRVLIERLRVVNRQLKDAHRQLDRLCGLLAEPTESEPGQANEQRDAAILASLPGNGRIVLATLLAEGWEARQRRDYHVLRTLCGAAPVTKRSGKSRIVTRRLACNPRLRNVLYHWARVAAQHDPRRSTRLCASAVTATHAPSARSAIDCSTSPARCFATAPQFNPSLESQKNAC